MATADKVKSLNYREFQYAGPQRPMPIEPEQATQTADPEPANTANAKLRAALSEAVALLQPALEQIELLQTQLVEAKEAHRKDAIELAAVAMREAETRANLDRALSDLSANQRQLLREEILRQEKHRHHAWWRLGR